MLSRNNADLPFAGYAAPAIEPCPIIASADGSIIRGRFATHQIDLITGVEILGADVSIEVLEVTAIAPSWSHDRKDWLIASAADSGGRHGQTMGIERWLNIIV